MKNNFKNIIKKLRKKNNITQKQIANILEITERNYQRYEYGKCEPSFDNLIKISQFFNVSTDFLLGLTDDPTPSYKY